MEQSSNIWKLNAEQKEQSFIKNAEVKSIHLESVNGKRLECTNGKVYEAAKVILTVPLPSIKKNQLQSSSSVKN